MLRSGSCNEAKCWAGFNTASGFGVCLEDLITTTPEADSQEDSDEEHSDDSTNVLPIILGSVLGGLALILGSLVAARVYYKKRRQKKTKEFQDRKEIEKTPAGLTLWRHLKQGVFKKREKDLGSPKSEFFPVERHSMFGEPAAYEQERSLKAPSSRIPSPAPVLLRQESNAVRLLF